MITFTGGFSPSYFVFLPRCVWTCVGQFLGTRDRYLLVINLGIHSHIHHFSKYSKNHVDIYNHGSQEKLEKPNNQPKNCQIFASSLVKTVRSFNGFEITGTDGSLIMTFLFSKNRNQREDGSHNALLHL
jgi:hypothetical protein